MTRNDGRIPSKQLKEARDVFSRLLGRRTVEADWQRFFARYPFVLSTTLPLALRPDHIIPMARPGKADPDFVIYPWDASPVPFYGVVELKKPDSQIITVTRSNVALLTRDAETAIEQSKVYVEELGCRLRHADRQLLCLGNQAYIFVVMGLRSELSEKLGENLFREQIDNKLPRNLSLLPYDTVFERFDATVPPKVMFVVPKHPIPDDRLEQILRELDYEQLRQWASMKCA